ncbi:FAD-dependent oxidoreductase [Mesorhizobium sp. RMAD-H1]|uniref:hydroxysqualene dehydroxylase n=1 Tax=Mesorhizobium sp. RMAD-H1 TaxID=2587065 RepID=UPI00181F980A|nr:FAD-dependent oxidoreductase [Mesorhizobium sp. RMAD-H1]MBB2974359.1 15-cis-phytoene desaturase [Mesorhizobium sp. RMAD-H1]
MNEVVVVGAGLAGLTAGYRLASAGVRVHVTEARPYVGGRTASWDERGMKVESGLHRYIGIYSALPRLMQDAGIDLSKALIWEDEVEIRVPDGPSALYGASPLRRPFRTIWNVAGPGKLCTPGERARLGAFFAAGLLHYAASGSTVLDRHTVRDFAKSKRVSDRTIERILVPLTEGLFFYPPERYSAYVLFALLAQGAKRALRSGVAAFSGGMTEVMADPIAERIRALGGTVQTAATVTSLVVRGDRVVGITVRDREITAKEVVLATSLAPAQELVRKAFGIQSWNEGMLSLKTMPSATLQLELERPALPVDRGTFGPGTSLSAFTEQSRTTFTHVPGRLSIILSQAELRLLQRPEEILEEVCRDAPRLGFELKNIVRDYRVVTLPHDFYSLTPGMEALRPPQETPIAGLTLAGDYTRQNYLTTMEGAVISGEHAAAVVTRRLNG